MLSGKRSAAVPRTDVALRCVARLRRRGTSALPWAWRTLAAVAHKTVFTWNGRRSGCFERISAAIPEMWGAA